MKKLVVATMALSASLLAMGDSALASMDYDYSGVFVNDNDVKRIDFTLGTTSDVTFFTSSWDDGGFDPVMTLWKSTDTDDNYMNMQDDGNSTGSASSNNVSYDYGNFDVFYTASLGAGDYIITLTQTDNYSRAAKPNTGTLADGFVYDQIPDFTFVFEYGPNPNFNGLNSTWPDGPADTRTGDWACHLSIEAAPVPVPPSVILLATSLAGLAGVGVRRKK